MTRPTAAFITFENDLGKMLAVEADDVDKERKLLGRVMKFKNASEPTDIIWENRHFTKSARFMRTLVVSFVVFLMLCVSFALIYTAQKTSMAMK